MTDRTHVNYQLINCLRLLKLLHSIGVYEKAVGSIQEITEDDYYELALLGLEHVAPVFDVEELGDEVCCGGHTVYHFSDPAIPEYYRLCRLYEHKHGIEALIDPYVIKADEMFRHFCNDAVSSFGACFNDEVHIRELLIEICPEQLADEMEIIEIIYNMLGFYRIEVERLRSELLSGPMVWLPALPPYVGRKAQKKPRGTADKQLMKAG